LPYLRAVTPLVRTHDLAVLEQGRVFPVPGSAAPGHLESSADVRVAPQLQGEERMAALEVKCDRLVALGARGYVATSLIPR
jgi:hypothetical protein